MLCKSKQDFLDLIGEEDQKAARSKAGRYYLKREDYRRSLEIAKRAAKIEAMEPGFIYQEGLTSLLEDFDY